MLEAWYCLLPIALLRVREALKTMTKLSPFEMTYGRWFLTLNMLGDPENQAHKPSTSHSVMPNSL